MDRFIGVMLIDDLMVFGLSWYSTAKVVKKKNLNDMEASYTHKNHTSHILTSAHKVEYLSLQRLLV